MAGQRAGDRPCRLVGGAGNVLAVGAGRDVDGDDQAGRPTGGVQTQGAAEGLGAADDAAGGVGEDDRVDAGDVDVLGDQLRVREDCVVGGGEVVEDVGTLGGVCSLWVKNRTGAASGVRWGSVRASRRRGWGVRGRSSGRRVQVEVEQHLLQAVLGHRPQDREVQGGGAQGTVLVLAATVAGAGMTSTIAYFGSIQPAPLLAASQ